MDQRTESRRRRGTLRISGATLAFLAPLAVALALAPSASAGTWTLLSCAQPNGEPAPTDGWTSVQIGGQQNYSGDSNSCSQPGGALIATSSSAWPETRGTGWMWQFTAPAGSTITGGQINLTMTAPVGQTFVLTPNLLIDSADDVINCQFNLPCGPAGTLTGSFPIDHPGGTSIYAGVMCLGPGQPGTPTADCPASGATNAVNAQLAIYSAQIELANDTTPTATAFSGSLLTPNTHGTADLTFTATDPDGPGIDTITVLIDGNPLYQGTPDTNQGQCTPVGTDPNGYPEFLTAQPCQQTADVDLPIDTTSLTEGQHDLQVIVTDAAGNTSTVLDQTITTLNNPTVSNQPATPATATPPPTATTSTPTTSTASTPAYALTISPATRNLTADVRRRYNRSAVTLAGTLEDTAGVAAPGVPVTLWDRPAGSARFQQLTRTTTDGDGAWELTAPRGPSRLLRVVAGGNASPTKTPHVFDVNETVTPTLSFNVITPGRRLIVFTGRLEIAPLGHPRPFVFIETPGPNGWEEVGAPVRVNPDGSFHYTYRSSPLTTGRRFNFRATTPQTTAWQAATSTTRTATVHGPHS